VFDLHLLLRENIKKVKPYASARDEYVGSEGTFLDANENAIGSVAGDHYNRYPDPRQRALKERISILKRIAPQQVFLGNGSDEAIDLLFRAVCVPGVDNVITMPPTYGMYEVSAGINDIRVKEVPLTSDYMMRPEEILKAVDNQTKIIFICSPNNPTGNSLRKKDILQVITGFQGIVVLDEAYIDFAAEQSFVGILNSYPNLVIMQTFSKAWGMASLRLGMAFASTDIVDILTKIKAPYNINGATQQIALKALDHVLMKEKMVSDILAERANLTANLSALKIVSKVFPSDANFILVKFSDGRKIYDYLISQKIITRDRSKVTFCEDSLRITVGTKQENDLLLDALKKIS
jgi:histidinol-phosphate aminotransferase